MKILSKTLLFLSGLCVANTLNAQVKQYTLADAHSHNDYKNNIPFLRAYEKGFGSIEADLYAVNGKLMVAHEKEEILPTRSFQNLYVNPLIDKLKRDQQRSLRLLIEVKEDYKAVLPLVVKELAPLAGYLNSDSHSGRLTIVITGAVPPAAEMDNYPDWMLFDANSLKGYTSLQWKKIGLVSFSFTDYVKNWNGKGVLNPQETKRLQGVVDSVHTAGKKIRFWATPDTKSSWLALSRLGVDVIGTDAIEELGDFLITKSQSEYVQPRAYQTYNPSYKTDGADKKVKNIILCIGDGMGLSQLYSTFTANRSALNIFGIKNIGFSVTNAADTYITDSAAGATAMASGQKTNNRAIGVDPQGRSLKSLAEYFAEAGKKTAVIALCDITDATPAAFYAHNPERSNMTAIANDLYASPIDIFLGAGYSHFTQLINGQTALAKMQQRGYTLVRTFDGFLKSTDNKILGLMDDSVTRPKMEGRGDYLTLGFKKVANTFKTNPQGFFMMIEGSQIDHGGHGNNLKQIITENADFDRMVGDALRFADQDGETLVIVTADHETGGLTLLDGDISKGYVTGNFSTSDHTGTPVPVFAYGPQSGNFRGVYPNTAIFNKLKMLIK
jgi:alkaline phosphatase